MIRVLIADDETAIRSSLRFLVAHEAGMEVVAEAADGQEAVELARAHRLDVVLMDVQMPRMTGLDATRLLCAEPSGPRVIVLTMFDLDEYVFEALRAGASGFLLKNSPPGDVLRAIRVAHDGEALLAPEVTRRLIDRFTGSPRDAGADRGVGRLTERERETLRLIGRGLSNAEIAAALFVTQTTVRTYVSRILSKLSARDRAQLVVAAYESGLVGALSPE
ncbi:response regulator transcription factor [Microbacterium sp.]|uniref:response regulator transcription factor n=1 Tax=Microbacterium sp. TaxID=51671 RepID=UPI0039E4973A